MFRDVYVVHACERACVHVYECLAVGVCVCVRGCGEGGRVTVDKLNLATV